MNHMNFSLILEKVSKIDKDKLIIGSKNKG
jgi:hypothetical protein